MHHRLHRETLLLIDRDACSSILTTIPQALLAVGFAEMMVIVSSGLVRNHPDPITNRGINLLNLQLAQNMVADIGGVDKVMWMPQTTTIVNLALGSSVAQAADYWGRKWPIVISCTLAIVGSLILSRATDVDMALAGNVLASISLAAQPLLYAVASEILPRKYRPAAQGGITGIFAVAAIVALLMGSAFVRDNAGGWRVVWYFNAGLFTFATLVTLFCYNPPPRDLQVSLTFRQKMGSLDWVGICLLPGGVTLFVVGLTWSSSQYSWTDAHVLGPFLAGACLLLVLGAYERFVKKDGLFHHGLFKQDRNLSIALFSMFVEGMAFFVGNTYFPMEVAILFEKDPVMVGLRFCVVFFAATLSSVAASIYCSRSKQLRWPLVTCFSLFVVFYGMFTRFSPHFVQHSILTHCQ